MVKSTSLSFNKFYTSMASDSSSNSVYCITVDNSTVSGDTDMSISNEVILKEVSVSEKLGFLPLLQFKIPD